MEGRLEDLQAQVEGLARELREIRERVDGLEQQGGPAAVAQQEMASGPAEQPVAHDSELADGSALVAPSKIIALIGRTLMILGGGYLFRALTDAAVVPSLVGVVAGLAYGAWWFVRADRVAAAGERVSGIFYGLSAAMIGYPLVWEAAFRFELLGTSAAATTLVLFLGIGLGVAWRRDLQTLAWIVVLFAQAAMIGLLVGTRDLIPFSVALLVLAAGVEVLALRDRWLGLRWPAALGLDLAVLILISSALREGSTREGLVDLSPAWVVAVCVALPVLYLATIPGRTLLRARLITPFEVSQSAMALLAGFGGAARVVAFNGGSYLGLAIASVAIGVGCYVASFTVIDRRSGRGANFYSYSTFACLLIVIGSGTILPHQIAAFLWSALALVAVVLGVRFDRITLRFHGAVYVTAAAVTCGLIGLALDGLSADLTAMTWRATPACILVALAAMACYGILVTAPSGSADKPVHLLPQALIAAVIAWSAAGMATGWLAGPLLAAFDAVSGPAFVAAGRTATIAVLAVALAWAARRWSLRELAWLVYPVLVAGAVKLLWEDFDHDYPLPLFLALAFYGGALAMTPRLLRSKA
jgi:hypothetical protein